MHVIRRGLLVLILVAPLVFAASVVSAPTSRADASCDSGSGANVGGNEIGTYVCLTIDATPVAPRPLQSSDGGPPLVCWLEPQYTPAQLDAMITADSNLSESTVGEGVTLYGNWLTNYKIKTTPPYEDGQDGWWWGVGCDTSNLNAYTYMEQLWSEIPGLGVFTPWEWVPNENVPAGPPDEVTTPAMLALYAEQAATLDKPDGQMSPEYTGGVSTQTVGLPTYFWGRIGDGANPVTQHTITASVQWLQSIVQATPVSVTITTTGATSGPSTITCPVTAGQFGTADPGNTSIPDDPCSFTYTRPSNDITVTMTTNWTIDWLEADGAAGWPAKAQSDPQTFGGINVQEIQTINNGSAPTPTS